MLCGSFSKTLAPGYRIGFAAPGRWRDRVELLKFSVNVATTTLVQRAVARFLKGRRLRPPPARPARPALAHHGRGPPRRWPTPFPAGTRDVAPARRLLPVG